MPPIDQPSGGGKWGWVKGLLPIIGSVAGAIIQKGAQDSANKANAQNVDKQIDFQREMANTAYQRGTADMKAAGLNPALGYKQGGADSPTGAAADNRANTAGQQLGQAVKAYNQFANGTAQRQLIREQAAATSAQARKTMLEGNAIQPQAYLGTNADYINDYAAGETAKRRGERYAAERTADTFHANLGATQQQTATARQQQDLMSSQATLNEQQFMTAWYRKNIAPYVNSTAHGVNAGVGMIRGAKGITPKGGW